MLLKIAQNNFPSRQRIVISSLVLQLAEAHNHSIVSMTLHSKRHQKNVIINVRKVF